MAGIAHVAVGLAVKPLVPEINVGWLILATWMLDVLWVVFWAVGLETSPAYHGPGAHPPWWDHSLLMAVVWSVFAGWFCHHKRMLVVRWAWRDGSRGFLEGHKRWMASAGEDARTTAGEDAGATQEHRAPWSGGAQGLDARGRYEAAGGDLLQTPCFGDT